MYFASGTYYSHYSSPAVTNANTRLKCGQYSESMAPIKLTTTDYGQMSAGSSYYFRYPLIRNPASTNSPLVYNFRLLRYESNQYYPTIVSSYSYENLENTQTGNSNSETC
jgi:hypothetical protein